MKDIFNCFNINSFIHWYHTFNIKLNLIDFNSSFIDFRRRWLRENFMSLFRYCYGLLNWVFPRLCDSIEYEFKWEIGKLFFFMHSSKVKLEIYLWFLMTGPVWIQIHSFTLWREVRNLCVNQMFVFLILDSDHTKSRCLRNLRRNCISNLSK